MYAMIIMTRHFLFSLLISVAETNLEFSIIYQTAGNICSRISH